MDALQIRPAVAGDCPRLLQLIRELAAYEKAPEQVTVSLAHFRESGFGAQPLWQAWVAETGGDVVAMALYYVRYSTWKGQQLYLEDIIVTQTHRRQGIGTRLFDKLVAVAQEKGFSGMVWQVLDWNEPALRFYQKYAAGMDAAWVNCSLIF